MRKRTVVLLMATMLGLGVILVYQVVVENADVERTINRLGGTVQRDVAWGRPVMAVYLRGSTLCDNDLENINQLSSLRFLFLANSPVGDEGLAHLKGLNSIFMLDLTNTQVSDDGLEHLKEMPNLSWLWIGGTTVTAKGLEHLKGLPTLEQVNIQRTAITEEALHKVLPNVKSVRESISPK